MSDFISAEQRAAAERLYNIATRLQGIVMQKGESAGLDAHTMISAESEYNSFIKDLNLVTGMSFNAPEPTAERGIRFGAMVASMEQLKRAASIQIKKNIVRLEILTTTVLKRNVLTGKNFRIIAEIEAEGGEGYYLPTNDDGKSIMSARGYWEEPRVVATPAPTPAPEDNEN